MCRPPDITPAAAGFTAEDQFDPYGPDVEEWDTEANHDGGEADAAGSDMPSVLRKRSNNDDSLLAEVVSRASKVARPAAPVSSAFDTAAASFVARMENSLLQDSSRLTGQQQQRLPASSKADNVFLLQPAVLQQQNKKLQQLQELQQLQLLKQLYQQPSQAEKLAKEKQQLLLVEQQLLQQSQRTLLASLNPTLAAATATNPSFAPLLKQPVQPAQAFLQTLSAAQVPAASAAAAPLSAAARALPALQPKPTALASAAAALACTPDLQSAASIFGLGAFPTAARLAPVGEEKKAKRMQSNRASAKRSRQRRQARLEELDKTTATLQAEKTAIFSKLERAQTEIASLEERNNQLVEEVVRLRKMLGMAPPAATGPLESSFSAGKHETSSGTPAQQESCVDSAGTQGGKVPMVKSEAESELALDGADWDLYEEDDEAADDEDAKDDEEDVNVDAGATDAADGPAWLTDLPLSPTNGDLGRRLDGSVDDIGSPVLEQMLQGDVFAELLASFDV